MKKLKVMTVVGTRPEIIRLSLVIRKLDSHCDHILVHTGQNYDYELNKIFFDDLNIRKPNYYLDAAAENANTTIGNILIKIDKLLVSTKPDAVLVLGDTNSGLSVIAAKRHKIPTFHMEAGNRCFDMRVPEEINRKIIDHTADINLPYSDIARNYLLAEALPAERIITTGSPMFEVVDFFSDKIKLSNILNRMCLSDQQFFLVSAHREENIDGEDNFKKLKSILNFIAEKYQLPIIVSTHPRTRHRIDADKSEFNSLVKLSKPLGYFDYNKLQISAKAVLSDSGTINEESSILNFPALNIREAHERPEAMEEAVVMMTGLEKERIIQGLRILESQKRGTERTTRLVKDYDVKNVSDKILRIVHSYTNFVNQNVWKKY